MDTVASQPKAKTNPVYTTIACLLGGLVGLYCGAVGVIPLMLVLFVLFISMRYSPVPLKPLTPALAIIFAHMVWMFTGALLTRTFAPVIDCLIIVVGLSWIVWRPGLAAVVFVSLYEVISLVANIVSILRLHFGTVMHKGLTVGIGLRIFALLALIVGYRRFINNQTEKNIERLDHAA